MHTINILLVDDQLPSLLALEDILAGLDATLVKASSAKHALRVMLDQHIDCILLDVSMPDMDGFDFLKTLHAAPAHAAIPVIMVTGKIFSDNETLRAYQHGAVDFLLKPLDPEVVYRKVSFFVEQARRIKSIDSIEQHLTTLATNVIDPLQDLHESLNAEVKENTEFEPIIAHLEDLSQAWRLVRKERGIVDLDSNAS